MMKIYSLICLLLFAANITYGQSPAKTTNPNDTWEIRWSASDEFNGGSPDWAKWIRTGNLPNTSSWLWDNTNNVKVEDGIAELTMSHNAGNVPAQGTYFKSGILKSYNTFTYGYFEAKIKGSPLSGSGVCPSFWLFSNFDDSAPEGETIYSEIDVVELQQFDWYEGHQDDVRDMDLNLHAVVKKNGAREWRRPKQYPAEQLNKWRAPWDPRNDFHIYGCEVNENEIIWYVDGVEVGRKPNTYWNRPMNVTLSLGLRKPFVQFYDNRNNAINPVTDPEANALLSEMPTSMYVDYVRVWEKSGTNNNPPLPAGELGNDDFELGNLDYWGASSGTIAAVNNNAHTGTYCASVSNASVAQIVALEANTTYTVTAYGKVAAGSTNAFMGVSKAISNELIDNFEFTSTSYSQGSITFTTGASAESYRFWYWSGGTAYCDDFDLTTGGTTNPPTNVAVSGVSVAPTNLSLTAGQTSNLATTVSPSNATNKAVTWSTSNPTVATVNGSGIVTAVAAGAAAITVQSVDGGHTATAAVTVSAPPVNTNKLDNPGFETGDMTDWTTAGNASVVSSNVHSGAYAAYVNGNGSVNQTVSLQPNTTYTASCFAKVGSSGQSVYLGVTNETTSTFIINTLITSTTYVNSEITFTTGSATQDYKIWFWNNGGGQYYADDFTLTEQGGGTGSVAVSNVAVSPSVASLNVGATISAMASVLPANASNKAVSWSSSHTTVATVSANGLITAVAAGSATITVSTNDGGYTATCVVSVQSTGGGCSVPAWQPTSYSKGEQVSHNGHLYEVKWTSGVKNGGCEPGPCAGWIDLGNCSSARIGDADVEETVSEGWFQVFPNPAKDYIQIELKDASAGQVSVLDIQGKVILRKRLEHGKLTLDTNQLSGLYLLKIETTDQSYLRKIIVE
ncbi:Ig-like domain-containing protein [Reichenbachiella carrageenanivorans]|uniref:Ig-like domain-containing protein n=1 Tax=Reichenbachiella carrageenanivorans TaxID=2979869 RepID=A0ABY6CZ39_9BACT|nr:Ig-like domain-containing protein [Reichenbachiella carrageenanivorans]UXX79186.1 Ig-like domain-containing protein [Reichenbachiella carrageenanivorans]